MENKTTREQILKTLFATHPKADEFYLTSNDQAFLEMHHAEAHGSTLADKKVRSYSRAEFEKVDNPIASSETDETANERTALVASYTKLFGKAPNHMTGVAKLTAAIEAKEAELENSKPEGE